MLYEYVSSLSILERMAGVSIIKYDILQHTRDKKLSNTLCPLSILERMASVSIIKYDILQHTRDKKLCEYVMSA